MTRTIAARVAGFTFIFYEKLNDATQPFVVRRSRCVVALSWSLRQVEAWHRRGTLTATFKAQASVVVLLTALAILGPAACITRAQAEKPKPFRVSGAFCGTAWSGVGPQFAELHKNSEITLMRPGKDVVVATATTDSDGRFQFANVPRGTYQVGSDVVFPTSDTVEITSTDQHACAQPLIVILYFDFSMMDGGKRDSRIVAKLPLNFANAVGETSKERAAASTENMHGLQGGLDDRERHFRAAIALDPTYWLPHTNLGTTLMVLKRDMEAESEFREGVRYAGYAEVAYWMLAGFLVDRGRDADAEALLTQLVKDGRQSAGIEAGFGLLAFRKHDWKESERRFRGVYEYTPESLTGFRNWEQWEAILIAALHRQGKHGEADERYKSMGWLGEDPWVLSFIAGDMIDRGDRLNDAVRMTQKALTSEPENGEIIDTLGWGNFKLGKREIAERQLKDAVQRLPDRADPLEHLAELYAATGRKELARPLLQKALEHSTDAFQRQRLTRRLAQI